MLDDINTHKHQRRVSRYISGRRTHCQHSYGSTAYSLSNGGPIIVPQTGILCLTPVAPHSLNIRPMVISDDSEITLTVESRNHNFLIAVDGQSAKCSEKTRLTIRKAPYNIKIVKRSSQKYFSTLRQKMMWGTDTRG